MLAGHVFVFVVNFRNQVVLSFTTSKTNSETLCVSTVFPVTEIDRNSQNDLYEFYMKMEVA